LQAVGDPVRHPPRGIERTKWSPAWSQDFSGLVERLKAALVSLNEWAEWFAASMGFEAGSWDLADLHRLGTYRALLMLPEAADGALLLEHDATERVRAMRAMRA
jgi:hypothetical protein